MLAFLGSHLPQADDLQGIYVEPFVGGGAIFFLVNPRRALLADINFDLIDLYRGIKNAPKRVWARYCSFGATKADYQLVRDSRPSNLVDRAARVLFLNRTCFKGMWRHNKNGEFNVGYGGQGRRWAISEENLLAVSRALRSAELHCCDFEQVISECMAGDFVFADPPYRPGEKEQTNDHYVGRQFTFTDQCRLASALNQAKLRGVHWALTNSAHPEIVELFHGSAVTPLPRGTGRRPGVITKQSGEVLITTYSSTGDVVR